MRAEWTGGPKSSDWCPYKTRRGQTGTRSPSCTGQKQRWREAATGQGTPADGRAGDIPLEQPHLHPQRGLLPVTARLCAGASACTARSGCPRTEVHPDPCPCSAPTSSLSLASETPRGLARTGPESTVDAFRSGLPAPGQKRRWQPHEFCDRELLTRVLGAELRAWWPGSGPAASRGHGGTHSPAWVRWCLWRSVPRRKPLPQAGHT